jgi:glycerophosphoryl diester phosphodiesterase
VSRRGAIRTPNPAPRRAWPSLASPSLAWLTARPIAHRGLHDAARGIVENTASAAAAAIAGRYGIEADLQISAADQMIFEGFRA